MTLYALPQLSGRGYYPYSPVSRQFGTRQTLDTITDVCGQIILSSPDLLIGVGDLSFADGGPMQPHTTHTTGQNVDIRPLRKDGRPLPVTFTDPSYCREDTAIVIAAFLAHRNVKKVLFNDLQIPGVHFCLGHHNHFHVIMTA